MNFVYNSFNWRCTIRKSAVLYFCHYRSWTRHHWSHWPLSLLLVRFESKLYTGKLPLTTICAKDQNTSWLKRDDLSPNQTEPWFGSFSVWKIIFADQWQEVQAEEPENKHHSLWSHLPHHFRMLSGTHITILPCWTQVFPLHIQSPSGCKRVD